MAICDYLNEEMVKRTCSLLTLIVLVLTQCFIPINYSLAENNAEEDFLVEENTIQDLDDGDSLGDDLEWEEWSEDDSLASSQDDEENVQDEENVETGSKVKKILPYSFLNSFMLTKTDIPLCYGYFTSIDMINSAYQNRLKGYLLTAAEKNQIHDSALIEQISTFKLRQTKQWNPAKIYSRKWMS